MFVVVTIFCLWLGLQNSSAMKQRDAIAGLASKFDQFSSHPSLQVEYDYQWDANGQRTGAMKPPGPAWLHSLVGVDFFQTVNGLYLHVATDEELRELPTLHHLRWLDLACACSDEELHRLAAFQSLTTLRLDLTFSETVTDRGLQFLGELKKLTSLKLTVGNSVTADGLRHVGELANLEELDLTFDGQQGEAVLAEVSKLSKLKKLEIKTKEGESQVNQGLAHLSAIRTLEELDFGTGYSASPIGIIAPSNLGAISSLKRLKLYQWSGESLEYLAALHDLEELDIVGAPELCSTGLIGLHALPKLRALSLNNCDSVTLQGLKGTKSLRELSVWHCETISRQGLVGLDGLANLRKLRIEQCKGISLEGLRGCPTIEELVVDLCETSGDDLPHLAGLANLRALTLAGTNKLSLQKLPKIPTLEELVIERTSTIVDSDVACLAAVPSLKRLRMELDDSITNAALLSISQLTKLESLDLWIAPGVSDEGISRLGSLKHLKRLEISGRTLAKATKGAMESLRKALPECEIVYDRYY
jgi:Leucine-rich repeat (LRR) protein